MNGLPERLALRVMQIGALAAVVAVTTFNAFELDRFFVPKELVLHACAAVAALFALRAIRRVAMTRVDLLLIAYLAISAVSAAFATNRWLAMRALAISASGVLFFWTARGLRESGLARPLLNALALAVVVTAITSLLQTYGLDISLFSENRIPGGTLGNRNFIAHVAAFGFPLLLLVTLGAERTRSFVIRGIGTALVVAALVLTRSRAAWLAFAVVVLVFLIVSRGAMWKRLGAVVVMIAIAVAGALALPNALHWRGRNPYQQTLKRVADYQQGSGRGRLVQYGHTLLVAAHHPIVGVGPGNWAVDYPAHAARHDPSMSDNEPGMTTNPWPSSDWFAIIAERGPFAAIALALAFLGIALTAGSGLEAAALLGTVAGALATGLFDAVLLLALPTFLVWSALGALWNPQPTPRHIWPLAVVLVIVISLAGAWRSASQLVAMDIYVTHSDRASLEHAAKIDPGNYRLQLRLRHGRAAHALYPNAR
jgi:O-antigen ligase